MTPHRRAPGRGFDPHRGATAEPHQVRPPNGAFVVIYLHGQAVGCGAVKHHPGNVTDIKRMWVAEPARGLGLARRLLEHLEDLARKHGSAHAHLETSDVLPEAIALYRSAGYAEVPPFNDEPFADRWFTKTLQPDHPAPGHVGGVPVQAGTRAVIPHGGAGIGVGGGVLHVAERDAGIQRRGDERVPQRVRADRLGDASAAGDPPHDSRGAVPVQLPPI